MKIYQYHPITKEFLWEKDARENPLEKGKYLVPAFATTILPHEDLQPEQVQVFEEEQKKWIVKKDEWKEPESVKPELVFEPVEDPLEKRVKILEEEVLKLKEAKK